jgi:hypothetical protein
MYFLNDINPSRSKNGFVSAWVSVLSMATKRYCIESGRGKMILPRPPDILNFIF